MIEYSGYQIDPSTFQIYKNGKEIKFPQSYCLESAKATIDASNRLKDMLDIGRYQLSSLLDEDDHREREQIREREAIEQYFETLNEPGL